MLEVKNLSVSYGRHRALEGVTVAVAKGEICVILGANGAGKSTLLKSIAGMVKPEPQAAIVMNGRPIAGLKPHRIVEEGIALVPEGRGIFGDLTVAENLQLGAFANRARRSEGTTLATIYGLFPRLAERKRQIARTMSGGEQQMVAIGRALMSKPDILMLDEPSLGLSPLLTKELFRSLKQVAATGVGILMVEQNARQSLAIADRGVLIENGLVTGAGRAVDLANDPAVVSAYLGGGAKASPKPAAAGAGLLPSIKLPAALSLPLDPAAWRGAVETVAGRAGRIQAAFVRALRREASVPSAFAGRYDPTKDADPWAAVDAPAQQPRPVSDDARRIAAEAASLAERASRILAGHVHAARTGQRAAQTPADAPLALVSPAADAPRHARPSLQFDVEALAQRAGRIQAAYVKALRAGVGRKPPFGWSEGDTDRAHSAWAALEAELAAPAPSRNGASASASDANDPVMLARAAGERLAAHVAASRQAAPVPSAFQSAGQALGSPSSWHEKKHARRDGLPAVRSLIGHNSAGAAIEEERGAAASQSGMSSSGFVVHSPASAFDPMALAARAGAIQAAHVAARRRGLVAFTKPAESARPTAAAPETAQADLATSKD
jgi:branched-chain amino acid transport system ATP-binding protein